jgi:putative membrane protein
MHQNSSHNASFLAQWIPLLIFILTAITYVCAAIRLTQKGKSWSYWRSLSFISGCVLVGIAVLPSLMQWAHHDMRGHMVQHLLIGMFAPIFLVLGAPISLTLKVLPVRTARVLSSFLKSSLFYYLTHPIIALLFNIGGMFLLYLTPLYNQSLTNPSLHYVIHFHFLVAGYLFTWSIIGQDPVPRRPGLRLRLLVLFVSMASHAFLSKLLYAYLLPSNSPHNEAQLREAAKLMYYWGDLSELFLVIVLFTLWYQKRGKSKYDLSLLLP